MTLRLLFASTALLGLAFAPPPVPVSPPPFVKSMENAQCLNHAKGIDPEASGNGFVCSADDVSGGLWAVDGSELNIGGSCFEGDIVTSLDVVAVITSGSPDRYNMGITINTGGGSAQDSYNSDCFRTVLAPITTDLSTVNYTSGVGPYPDITSDACGDIYGSEPQSPPRVTHAIIRNLNFTCTTLGSQDDVAKISVCFSWENNQNADNCWDWSGALPATPAKCRCEDIPISGLTVKPRPSPPGDCEFSEFGNFVEFQCPYQDVMLENYCYWCAHPSGEEGERVMVCQPEEYWDSDRLEEQCYSPTPLPISPTPAE